MWCMYALLLMSLPKFMFALCIYLCALTMWINPFEKIPKKPNLPKYCDWISTNSSKWMNALKRWTTIPSDGRAHVNNGVVNFWLIKSKLLLVIYANPWNQWITINFQLHNIFFPIFLISSVFQFKLFRPKFNCKSWCMKNTAHMLVYAK